MNSYEVSWLFTSTFKNRNKNCENVSTSQRPLSVRQVHSQTYHVGGATVSEDQMETEWTCVFFQLIRTSMC